MSTIDRRREFQEHLDKAQRSISDTHPEHPNITPETEHTELGLKTEISKTIYGVRGIVIGLLLTNQELAYADVLEVFPLPNSYEEDIS